MLFDSENRTFIDRLAGRNDGCGFCLKMEKVAFCSIKSKVPVKRQMKKIPFSPLKQGTVRNSRNGF